MPRYNLVDSLGVGVLIGLFLLCVYFEAARRI